MTRRPIYYLRRWSVISVIVVIFVAAILLSAGRWLALSLPDYKSNIEQLLSDEPHYQIRIGELRGSWVRLSPRLEASAVTITLDGGRRISVGRMELQFDTLSSIRQAEVVFNQVLLDQLELSLYRSRQAGWQLVGTSERQVKTQPLSVAPGVAAQASNLLPVIQALLQQEELELRNARVLVQFEQHDPLPPQLINLKLLNHGDQHAWTGQLDLGAEQKIEVRALSQGLPRDSGFAVQLYLNVPDVDQRFWKQILPDDLDLPQEFALGGELWGRWQADGQHSLQGALRLPQLRWLRDGAALGAEGVAFNLQLAMDGLSSGELAITDLQGRLDGVSLPLARLSGRKRDNQWLLSSDRLALQPLWRLINGSALIPDGFKQRLAGLDPVGVLLNPRFEWRSGSEPAPPDFNFSADLERVGVSAWKGAPTLQGVNGLLTVDAAGGQVDFSSDSLGLDFPKLFRQGWQFDSASGVVSWQIEPQRVRVLSQRLQLAGERVRANGRFSLDIPLKAAPVAVDPVVVNTVSVSSTGVDSVPDHVTPDNGEPHDPASSARDESYPDQAGRLVLMIGIEQSDVALASRFVPDKVVPAALFNWLETSIRGGQLNSGGLILDMPLFGNASNKPSQTLQMFFDVDHAALQYQPQWPTISQASPFMLYKDTELLVDLPRGRMLDTELSRSQVYLAPLSHQLQIVGTLDGPAADIRTTLIEGPTRVVLGDALQPWQVSGSSHSRLQLEVDLQQPQRSKIRFGSELVNGRLSNDAIGLDFDRINGSISYHERDGLAAEALTGRLFDQPLQATIETQQQPDGPHTLVRGSGTIAVGRLNQWLQQPVLQRLSGTTAFRAKLELCGADCSNLRIDSQLQGITADLPAPYGKTALQQQPLGVDLSLAGRPWLRLRYARQLDLLLPLGGEFSGGELVLGRGQQPPSRRDDGLWIRGQLGEVDAEPWQGFIEQYFLPSSADGPQTTDQIPDSPRQVANGGLLKRVELAVARLNYGQLQIDQLQASLRPEADRWLLQLDSPLVKGLVSLPMQQGVPQVALDYLRLPKAPAESKPESVGADPAPVRPFDPAADPLVDIVPQQVPAARIRIEALSYGELDLGRWRFELQPAAYGLKIADLSAQVDSLELLADIDWRYQGQSGSATPRHSSHADLVFKATDLERAMKAWGTSPGLKTESAMLSGQLDWNGSPLAFNWQTLDGEAELQADNGRLLDTGGGSQVLKVFSLLNSQTIWRRLRLDFSDLSQQGINFDRVTGHYRISDGVLTSRTPLAVVGPTLDLQLEGTLDLVNDTVDQQMLVTLPIAENLPVAAALLVSPAVAGAVFLVEKLIGDKLSKFTSVRYRVNGSLTDPQVQLLQSTANQQIESDH